MNELSTLELLKQQTAELVKQRLRSHSVVIAQLRVDIDHAVQRGYSHQTIHESIARGGLVLSFNTYRVLLNRARSAPQSRDTAETLASPSVLSFKNKPDAVESARNVETHRNISPSACSATRVLNALNDARRVASSRDYAQIGRDLFRKQQRDQRNERIQSHQLKDPT